MTGRPSNAAYFGIRSPVSSVGLAGAQVPELGHGRAKLSGKPSV